MSSKKVVAQLCPFCGSPNQCNVHDIKQCWCANAKQKVANTLLALSKEKNRACICKSCIKLYSQHPEKFKSLYIKEKLA